LDVGFVGTGSMGSMLVRSLIGSRALRAERVVASNRSAGRLNRLAEEVPGLRTAPLADLFCQCDTVFLCVKPPDILTVLADAGRYISEAHLLIVITNSVDLADLEAAVPARLAKVIPSLTQTVGAGIALLIFGSRCTEHDRSALHRLLAHISRPFIIDESQARIASDLTSCGPAFLSHVYRALARAAGRCQPDLPPPVVEAMVLQTTVATARLLDETGLSFDHVIEKVSTPGGITAEGIKVLDQHLESVWEEMIRTTVAKEHGKKVRVKL
jgi:competence protein ComER